MSERMGCNSSGSSQWVAHTTGSDIILKKVENKKEPKDIFDKVIFNKPRLIVKWSDGTKTIVKTHDEKFKIEKGFMHAFMGKHSGVSRTQISKMFKELKKQHKAYKKETV